jgi:hypothetical protein
MSQAKDMMPFVKESLNRSEPLVILSMAKLARQEIEGIRECPRR